ncbi:MAG TPA: phospholipid carrier-dependent glycosyltransferase [Caldilineae bacterium]|nr:phospholipid carrier-dependent glycosyltransferase [Caldilineae bacterium]
MRGRVWRMERWGRLGMALAGLVLAYLGQTALEADHLGVGLGWYALALAAWILAFADSEWLRDDVAPPLRPLPRRLELALFAAVLLIGLILRVYRLRDIPWGLSIDGSANALKALDILRGAPYEPLYLSRETMYHYFMAAFFRLLGPNLIALRLTSVFFGMLGLVAFYLLTREMFDARLALIATFLFATSVYHITYSRSGWRAIQVPVFEFAAFYCVLKAMRSDPSRTRVLVGWWALAGVMVGLGLNTYEPFRLVVIALGLWILSQVPRRGFLARHWRGLIAFAICSVVFFGPLGWYAVTHWAEFNARARAVFIGQRIRQARSLEPLWENVRNLLLTYNYQAMGDFFDNNRPLLERIEAILYVGGLGVLLGHLHRSRPRLLLGWFLLALLPGVFSWPNAQRLIAATPLAILFGGLFLYAIWVLLDEIAGELVMYPVLAAVGIVSLVWTYQVYLGPNRRIVWGYEPERLAVALYLKPIGETDTVLVEERFNQGQVDFINYIPGSDPFIHRFPTFDLRRDVPLRRPIDRPVTIVLEERPEHRTLITVLRTLYPDLRVETIRDGYGRAVALAVHIPYESITAAWGLRARYFADDGWQELLMERVEPDMPLVPPPDARSAEWRGFLWVDRLGEYEFQISGGQAQLEIDGRAVGQDGGSGRIFLTRGFHPLRLRAVLTGASPGYELIWREGRGSYELIPREHLFAVESPDPSLTGRPTRGEPWAWQEVWTVGGNGRAPGQFFRPMNIAIDSEGFVYVADADNRRIQKLRASDGSFVAEWGRLGTAPGELEHEMGLALGPGGVLYVSDRWNDRVQAWSTDGEFLGVVVPRGLVASPRAIVVLPDSDLLVASAGHRQIRRFAPDGTLKAAWGQPGAGPGQFIEPVGLAYDAARGLVYVTDARKHTVQQYTLDGEFLAEWLVPGVTWESYAAVGPEGRLYVTAPDENTVYIFDANGTMLIWGSETTGFIPFRRPLNHPMGLAFDENGDLYLTNTWADQVMRFRRVPVERWEALSDEAVGGMAGGRRAVPFEPRFVYRGNTESRVWEAAVGTVTVTGGELSVRVAAVPGYHAVYDYLRLVSQDGREYRFEAEDTTITTGDTFSLRPGLDDHWWLQAYEPFSGGYGLVAEDPETVPVLETTVRLPDGTYQMFLGTFTGDPANGPFAITLDF